MKQINFILISGLILAIAAGLDYFSAKVNFGLAAYVIGAVLTASSIFVTRWQVSTIEKSASRFVSSFMGGVGIKVIVLIIALIISLLVSEEGKLELGVLSIVLYISLMAENVRQLFQLLKAHK